MSPVGPGCGGVGPRRPGRGSVSGGQRFNETHTHYDAPEALDLDYFHKLEGRDRIRLIPCFYTWTLYRNDPAAFRAIVRSLLD